MIGTEQHKNDFCLFSSTLLLSKALEGAVIENSESAKIEISPLENQANFQG